jgi:hypothetical protein
LGVLDVLDVLGVLAVLVDAAIVFNLLIKLQKLQNRAIFL